MALLGSITDFQNQELSKNVPGVAVVHGTTERLFKPPITGLSWDPCDRSGEDSACGKWEFKYVAFVYG